MDEEYAQPRDVDADLAEITSRLGEPDATYRTNVRGVAWRFTVGVLFVVFAAGLHYAVWSGQVPWRRGAILWKLLIIGMFVSPAAGLYLIYFAVRGLKLWVLAYPTGLFVWHRGRMVGFAWDEIQAVQIAGMPTKAVLNHPTGPDGLPETVWYDLTRSGRRVFGTTITLTRTDGEQVALPSTLDDFADLGRRVQQETFRRLFPAARAQFGEGHTLSFGAITCDAGGIVIGKKMLSWREVDALERVGDKLEVKQTGKKKKTWAKCNVSEIVNLHVLMGVAAAARTPHNPV
jgi:hypothetical protein